ncbi:hypothetical protein ANCCAN_20631 [Ancylostoma caninum]|uniref:Uncharacterized protein n=1 Tax=Ancylostoma caninum TaxID=29170 RepID=A0A368FN15_ANCCA|nr:hypothetical protein ANCCAN_20631 [Ancylostoma caninum]
MVAFAVIIFYYLFLSELFLPVYFHFVMPLPVQKLNPKRTRSPKRLTFDVTMTAEDTTEKSSRDYSAATPPYRASVSGERSYKRATKSTTPSSRKGDPPMAKTQKSHTPSPSTPLGF